MKVSGHKTLKPIEPFNPVVLRFEFKTLKEAQVIHNLFNYAPICDYIENNTDTTGEEIREAIEKVVPDFKSCVNWGEFLGYFK